MLSSLRKFSETLTAKIFIALIALSFVFWGINDFYKSSYNNAIAEINGDEISFNEFTKEYSKIIRSNNIQSQKLAIEKNIHIIAISNIISEKLLKIHAKNLGILIDDTVIAIEINFLLLMNLKKIIKRKISHKFII